MYYVLMYFCTVLCTVLYLCTVLCTYLLGTRDEIYFPSLLPNLKLLLKFSFFGRYKVFLGRYKVFFGRYKVFFWEIQGFYVLCTYVLLYCTVLMYCTMYLCTFLCT